jgi:hypothetical protein
MIPQHVHMGAEMAAKAFTQSEQQKEVSNR